MMLGEWLISKGYITESQLEQALENQKTIERGKGLGRILIESGVINERYTKTVLSRRIQIGMCR